MFMPVTHSSYNTASHMWTWQRDGSRCFQYTGRERTCRAKLFHMVACEHAQTCWIQVVWAKHVTGMSGLVTGLVWLLKTRKEVLKLNADKSSLTHEHVNFQTEQIVMVTWFPAEMISSFRDKHTHTENYPNITFTIFRKTWLYYIFPSQRKKQNFLTGTFLPFYFLSAK